MLLLCNDHSCVTAAQKKQARRSAKKMESWFFRSNDFAESVCLGVCCMGSTYVWTGGNLETS